MSYRFMRIIVFFDLPSITQKERRAYTKFRKHLIKTGFLMMQESVYCKLVLNQSAASAVLANLKKNKPDQGIVEVLTITEKQFSNIEILVGEHKSQTIDTDERLVII